MARTAPLSDEIAAIRRFNRLYTQRLGLLNARLDGSPFALTEARILYELAQRPGMSAATIGRILDIDKGQLSRIVARFETTALVESQPSEHDAKQRQLALTKMGRRAFAELEAATNAAVAGILSALEPSDRVRLLHGAGEIATVLDTDAARERPFALRDLRVGDLGWIAHRQALLYAQEYDWDLSYEALAAEILAQYVTSFDPAREQAWIAERDGAILGSVFLMRSPKPDTARLRLLYVEPAARGSGVGRTLVAACIARAREVGYARLELWTNSVLVSARRIYEAAGFRLEEEAPHRSFGHDLIGQTWALDLSA